MVWVHIVIATVGVVFLSGCASTREAARTHTTTRQLEVLPSPQSEEREIQRFEQLRWSLSKGRNEDKYQIQARNYRLAQPKHAHRWVPEGLWLASHNPKLALMHFRQCKTVASTSVWCDFGLALAYAEVREFKRALELIQKARADDPRQPRLAALEGRIRIALGEDERAQLLLNRFLGTHPSSVPVILAKAQMHLKLKEIRESRRLLNLVMTYCPNDPQPRVLLGQIQSMTGNQDEAIRYFHEALALDPKNRKSRRFLAVALDSTERSKESIRHWSHLCEREKHMSDSCLRLGNAHWESGAPQRALAWAEETLKKRPRYTDALVLKVRALIGVGRVEEALQIASLLYADPILGLSMRLTVAHALGRSGLRGRAESAYTQMVRDFSGDERVWLGYAQWYLANGHLSRAEVILRRGLERTPRSPTLHAFIALIFEKQDRPKAAMLALARSLELEPNQPLKADHLAYLEFTHGFPQQAIKRWQALVKAPAVADQVLDRLALAYRLTGQFVLAQPLAEELVARRPHDISLQSDLAETYLRSRESDKAIKTLQRIDDGGQHTKRSLALLANAFSASGRLDEADKTFQKALNKDPTNRPLRLTYASFRERMGDGPGAAKIYRSQLARDPDDTVALAGFKRNSSAHDTRKHTRELRFPAARADSRLAELVEGIPELGPTDVGAVLRDERYVEVDERGVKSIRHVRSVLIRRKSGVPHYEKVTIGFHTEHPPTIHHARVLTPDGRVRHIGEKNRSVKDPHEDTPLFGDTRHLVLTFEGLEPGTIIDYDVTTYRPHPELFSVWWDSYILGNADPTLRARYQLTLPEGAKFHAMTPGLAAPQATHNAGQEILVWERANLPGYRNQRQGAQMIPAVHLSSLSEWKAVDAWYHRLFLPKTSAGEAVQREARRIMARHKTLDQRIGAVLKYVERNIEYLGVEFGIGAYQPRPAASTLAQGKGDCKDMTALMIALLKAMKIKAYPVLAKPSDQGELTAAHPSPGQFSHVLMYIPRRHGDLWLDATATMSTLKAIPSTLRGQLAFVVDGQGGRLMRIPNAQPREHGLKEHRTYALTMTGGGSIQTTIELSGDAAGRSRQKLFGLTHDARTALLSSPGLVLGNGLIPTDLEIKRLSMPHETLKISAGTRHTDLVAVQLDGALIFDPDLDIFTNGLLAAPGTGVQLETPRTVERTMVIRPPEGYVFDWPPLNEKMGGPLKLAIQETRQPHQTTIKTRITFALRPRSQTELSRLQHAFQKIRKALSRRLVIRPSKEFRPLVFLQALAKERPSDPQILYHLGRRLLIENRNRDASKTLEKARQHDPKNPEILALLTAVYLRERNLEGAKSTLRGLLETRGAHPRLFLTLASIVRSEGENEEAHRILNDGQKRFPNDVELQTEWITSLIHRREYADAAISAAQLGSAHPENIDVLRLWSDCAIRADDVASAQTALRAILSRNPNDLQALNNLAWSLRTTEAGLKEAIQLAERAVSLAPQLATPWETLAELYVKAHRLDHADHAFRKAREASRESTDSIDQRLQWIRRQKDKR